MKSLLFLLSLVLSSNVFAMRVSGPLNVEGLKTQFEESVTMTPETQWVVFVAEKAASKVFNDKVKELNVKLDEKPILYVSDISKMPSLITRMFAIPKMKKIGYKMALDRKGEITKEWPRQEGAITVMEISNQKVTGIRFLSQEPEIKSFLKNL